MARTQKTSCSVEFDGTTVLTCGSNSATAQETAAPFGYSNSCASSYQGLHLSSAFKAALYDSIKAKDCLCSGALSDWGPGFTAITHSTLTTWGRGAAPSAASLPNRSQRDQDLTALSSRYKRFLVNYFSAVLQNLLLVFTWKWGLNVAGIVLVRVAVPCVRREGGYSLTVENIK